MTKDKPKKQSMDQIADEILEAQVAELDVALEGIEKRLGKYQRLIDTKTKLLSARRALLGTGSRTTGNAGTRLTVDDVIHFVKENPGCSPGEIAQKFGVAQTTVSSHIYRNKARFLTKDNRYWARDPEAGLDKVEDIEDDD